MVNFTSDKFFDIDEALRLGKLVILDENPHVRAEAHNNVGVYYHYSDKPNNLEMAKEHFHKSAELFSSRLYLGNTMKISHVLTLIYKHNKQMLLRLNIGCNSRMRMREWILPSVGKYPFGNDTSIEQALTWLRKRRSAKTHLLLRNLLSYMKSENDEILLWYTYVLSCALQ